MKTLAFGFLMALLSVTLIAQKSPLKFGHVSKEEVAMTTYDKDTTASAVILSDYGVSTIVYRQNVGFSLDFERTTRIKILTKNGLNWGDFRIPLYKRGSDDEKVSNLKAVTYNLEDGKIVESKLKKDGVFRETVDANWDQMKLTFPNVKEGSVVEINYKVNSPFLTNFQDWYFQSTIPVVFSEYRARIPEYFSYDRYMQGYISLAVVEDHNENSTIRLTSFERSQGNNVQSHATTNNIDLIETHYRWVAQDVPAFKPEPYMTAVSNYISKINFELSYIKFPNRPVEPFLGNWKDINKTMVEHDHFGSEITSNGFLKKVAEQAAAGAASPEDKITAITNYVRQNVAWDGRNRLVSSESLRKVLDNKKGSSAEINLLLGSMLEKAGLTVKPVMLSTRDNGLLRVATPVVSQFNYVVCLVEADGKSWLLDATERLLPVGMLPERCLNGQGFAVSKGGFQWVSLDTKFKTRSAFTGNFTLDPSGEMTGTLKIDCNGYVALRNRKKYLVDGESEYVKQFVGSRNWDIKSTSISNVNAVLENFIQEHELIVSDQMTVAGDMIYLNPFVHNSQKENPFKSEVREYPVDFGSPMEEVFHLRLTLPDEYAVDELPESKVLVLPGNAARYIYNVAQLGNEVTITSMFNINRSLFTQLEYPNLREFYNQVVAKQAEQIVLKKKL